MTMHISRKKFLDLGLGTLGAIGLGACGGDDGGDTGNDTGNDTSGGDDDGTSMTDPSSPTTDPDDDGSSSITDPSAGSSSGTDPTAESSGTDPTADGSTTDPDSSSGPGDESSSTGTPVSCESDPSSEFDLHPHTLDIPLADVLAGVEVTYTATGNHDHDVTVSAEDFAALAAGQEVTVISSFDNGHEHDITLICR